MNNGVSAFDLTTDPLNLSKSELTGVRLALALAGVLAVALGITALAWLEGVAALVETVPDASKWFGTPFGAISVVAGISILLSPSVRWPYSFSSVGSSSSCPARARS